MFVIGIVTGWGRGKEKEGKDREEIGEVEREGSKAVRSCRIRVVLTIGMEFVRSGEDKRGRATVGV